MISGTIKASPMKFCTVIVPLKAYQNQKEIFKNVTYDVTMTSILKNTMAKFGPPQNQTIIRKVTMRAFRKCKFY